MVPCIYSGLDSSKCMATLAHAPAVLEKSTEKTTGLIQWNTATRALAITIGLRVFYSALAAFFSSSLRLDPSLIRTNEFTDGLISRDGHPVLYALLGVWERFDTLWYVHIATHGYDRAQATVFYPLYPALIRVFTVVTRSELISAVVISTIGSFFLIWGALRIFEEDFGASTSKRAIVLWLAWPASFTFFAAYPESVLLALVVWSVWFARAGRWTQAGVLGFLAGCTKALGCMTALPLLWLAWRQRKAAGGAAAFACGAGALLFQVWLSLRHFPSASATYAMFWHTSTVAPWTTVMDVAAGLFRSGNPMLVPNTVALLATSYLALSGSVRTEWKLFAATALCLFLTKHTEPLLQSTSRYSLGLVSAFPALALWLRSGLPFACTVAIAAVINLFFLRVFLDWGLVV